MRLVADGVVEREGVDGLARALGYSTRQLNRVVTQQYGAGPLALARSRRAQTARVLIETTDLSFADIAFAAGFASVRQFNDTVREVYAASPTRLRDGCRQPGGPRPARQAGTIRTRIAVREPFADRRPALLPRHACRPRASRPPGLGWYERAVRLPHGPGVVRLELADRPTGQVPCTFTLTDARDLAPALERTRRLLDADCDPVAVDEALAEDPVLARWWRPTRGCGCPASSTAVERRRADGARPAGEPRVGAHRRGAPGRGARRALRPRRRPHEVTHLFPTMPRRSPRIDPESLRMPRSRGRALVGLARRPRPGETSGSTGAPTGPRPGPRCSRCPASVPGPPTTSPCGRSVTPTCSCRPTSVCATPPPGSGIEDVAARSETWRPWRSYALMRLWSVVLAETEIPPQSKNGDIG